MKTSNGTAGIARQMSKLRDRVDLFLGIQKAQPKNKVERPTAYLFGEYLTENRRDDSAGQYAHVVRNPTKPTQIAVQEVLQRINSRSWGAYMVGGTLRDLMLVPRKAGVLGLFPRDIDLVVIGATLPELDRCFADLIQRRTRFGGLHLVKRFPGLCEVHFDVWPLQETWAFKEFRKEPDISTFSRYPFLNMDAIAIDLALSDGVRHIYDEGQNRRHIFFNALTDRTVDINFEPNPYPDVCAMRGLIIAVKLGFQIGHHLARFICERARIGSLDTFINAQLSHYGKVRINAQEINRWLRQIESQLRSHTERISLVVAQNKQVSLWNDYPPMAAVNEPEGNTAIHVA